MRHFKKIDWPISLSLLFACVLIAIGACVEPSGPLGEAHVIEGGTTVVASVQITLAQSTLAPGKTTQATVVAKSADGKVVDGRVDFISQNPSVAAVSSNGVVTAVAAGIAVIQATVAGHGATAPVTVQSIVSPVAAVVVAFDSTKIAVGHVAQASATVKDTAGNPMTDQAITWSSLTPNVATVSSLGAVTAIAAGTASIEATASGINGSGTITVEATQSPAPAVAAVTVAFDSTKISVGHITQASAVVKDAAGNTMGGQTITWSSLTPAIASVSSSGVVTALAAGTASIRATASGISGSASIIVAPPSVIVVPPSVAVVTVTVDSTTLSIGHTAQAYATAKDSAGNPINGQTIVWTSLSPSVASVASSGRITALAVGIAVIQATVSGCSGSTDLTVRDTALVVADSLTLAFQDFNDGAPGLFDDFGVASITYPDDPTGSGRGKVARMLYSPGAGPNSNDVNMEFKTVHHYRYGETIWFKGEIYIPSTLSDGTTSKTTSQNNDTRKLIDYINPQPWPRLVLGREYGGAIVYSVGQLESGVYHLDVRTGNTGIILLDDTWYTIEVRWTLNSADGVSDGILEIYVNNPTNTPNFRLATGLSPITEQNGAPYFNSFLFGTQLSTYPGETGYSEYRYWNNVGFSTTRIGR